MAFVFRRDSALKLLELALTLLRTEPLMPTDALARVNFVGQRFPVPKRAGRVAALDAAVQVVPMVEHTELKTGLLTDVQIGDGLERRQQPQEGEGAVHRPGLADGGDDRDRARA